MKNLTPPEVLALLLLSFMANAQAADTYDASTQILTVPQVVVGNTTFSNVVVKLKDIEVLKADPNPLVGVVDAGFLMQFKSAVQQGNQLKITLDITSQFLDRVANVGTFCCSGYAELTDDRGNKYKPKTTSVGNIQSGSGTYVGNYKFAADLPTPVTFLYDNIATNAASIGLLDLKIEDETGRAFPAYKVRNIPFQKPSVVSPF